MQNPQYDSVQMKFLDRQDWSEKFETGEYKCHLNKRKAKILTLVKDVCAKMFRNKEY